MRLAERCVVMRHCLLRLEIYLGSSFPSHRKHLDFCYKEELSSAVNGRVLSHAKRSHILFNLNVPYCVRKEAPPLVPVRRHLNLILTFCRNHFTSVLRFAPRHTFSLVPHAPHLMPSNLVTFGEEYQSWSFGTWDFLYSPYISSLLRPHIFISTMCCDAVSLFLSCYERPSFTPLQNCSKNYNFLNFKPYFVVRQLMSVLKILNHLAARSPHLQTAHNSSWIRFILSVSYVILSAFWKDLLTVVGLWFFFLQTERGEIRAVLRKTCRLNLRRYVIRPLSRAMYDSYREEGR
jgi:hypothetical protein